jgi:transcriptional regulator with GAF, ATPase, and Fis domain
LIRQALKETGGVQTRAGDRLGLIERVLRHEREKYGIKGSRYPQDSLVEVF